MRRQPPLAGRDGRLRVGIDVGGTNTDAVVMRRNQLLIWTKMPTTPDITSGIRAALNHLFADPAVAPEAISAVMIGTTHFTNAFVERKNLLPAAAIRLGRPATEALPPMVDWPPDLVEAIGGQYYMACGGHQYDGREISPIDEQELRHIARDLAKKNIRSIAITSVFSPITSEAERRAAAVLRQELPDLLITLSSDIGRIGLLERENAATINASLLGLASTVITSFEDALKAAGLRAPLYITQNDGTLMAPAFAARYPVLTFASGPTNSIRGAAFLSGLKDAIVVDIGGTTTDVGLLINGFPRQSTLTTELGRIRTNFRMPDLMSLSLGGGSIVRLTPAVDIQQSSVGADLLRRALVFGGDTVTASDIAVAAGIANFGERSRVAHLPEALVKAALEEIARRIEVAVDRVRIADAAVPLILVGGGSVLLSRPVRGASQTIRPPHFRVANAVGSAIAQVGGEVDRIFTLRDGQRESTLAQAQELAREKARRAGARPETIEIVEVEEVPLAYLPDNAVRVRVKAVGELATM